MSTVVWLCILGLMIALGIVVIGLIIWRIVNGQPTKSTTQPLTSDFLDLEIPTPRHVYSEPIVQQPEEYPQSPKSFKRCPSCGSTDVVSGDEGNGYRCNSCGKSWKRA